MKNENNESSSTATTASFLTARDVATTLNVALATVYKLVDTGELAVHRFSTNVLRVSRADLDAYIAGSRSPEGHGRS